MSEFGLDGTLITQLGVRATGLCRFAAPHDVWIGDHGVLYVCEVQRVNRLHKFIPV